MPTASTPVDPRIADRAEVFYWQTDRAIEPEVAGQIWADRHRYFSDRLIDEVNAALDPDDPLVTMQPRHDTDQWSLGNVNSVRTGQLASGRAVIVRCHPRGVPNGYFHAESAAAHAAADQGVPTYATLAVHDYTGTDDFAFQVTTALPGVPLSRWLEDHPGDEPRLLRAAGRTMAHLHQVEVDGFGPFDNARARGGAQEGARAGAQRGPLQGLHSSFAAAVRAALPQNLEVLVDEGILTAPQRDAASALFAGDNPLLQCPRPVLVHNDFADWNLLTEGEGISGVVDFDECVGGDPVSDLACWSTFFDPARLELFLSGYWEEVPVPPAFTERFELLRLRYVISKMVLRVRRYRWDPSAFMADKIEVGRIHLAESLRFFAIG